MKLQRRFSLRFVFLIPLLVSVVLSSVVVKSHYDLVNRSISAEYDRLKESLWRSSKVISALDYSFTNYYRTGGNILVKHNTFLENDLCKIWPIDAVLRTESKSNGISAVDINYMLVGNEELCDPTSPIYKRASSQVALAPVLSFMHDLDNYLIGIHYSDKEGYIVSSPDTLAQNVTSEYLDTMKARPYWRATDQNRGEITVSGPVNSMVLGKEMMSLTVPVHSEESYEGLISLDIDLDTLLYSGDKLSSKIRIIDRARDSVPGSAFWVRELVFEGVVFNHTIFYDFDLEKEVKQFFSQEKYSLLIILLVYIFSVLVLFYVNTNAERSHFRDLAAKDPMTGLLNRRGFEAFLTQSTHEHTFAVAVFDIDNFKSINDTYGHDVGDDVICYIADQLEKNIRADDAVARFGGEEFVVYLKGYDEKQLIRSLERVRIAISEKSTEVIEQGFTVSGGAEIMGPTFDLDFVELFKLADEKLYQAKTSGKNKLIY
ncbi:diguanylate cyclase [Vibrio sp. ZSDE26]|uniref:diguanylate cyclase n=1 Tax=Vibrio amylolyticus TaxID=2847292 RepID=A0A9X2BJQ4_9VIBR|nr:diguanylate cyclase [Vibrio amylolyticus]MCK6261983.1 diguanylate cyclase [Vibrio amylolyticus]